LDSEKWKLIRERSEHHHRWVVSTYINRPFSNVITYFLIDRNVTPNQISVFTSLFSFLSFLAYVLGNFVLAGVLTQVLSIVDGVDGEIARAKNLCSNMGAVLDSIFDRLAEILICLGVGFGAFMYKGVKVAWFFSLIGIIGFLIDNYVAELVKSRTGCSLHEAVERLEEKIRFSPSDRGLKMLLICILSVFNLPEWGVLIAGLISILYVITKFSLWLVNMRGRPVL